MKAFMFFPGQGAQYQGMALDLLEASKRAGGEKVERLFSIASDAFGKDMTDLLANSGPEILKRTDVSQPAITLANLAAAFYLEERGVKPLGCAGFSLGEYAALAAAGVITVEDCFLLVTARGKAMQTAVDGLGTGPEAPGMAAVIGLPPEKVEALAAEWKSGGVQALTELYPANINSPRQTVVAGTAKALAEAEGLFTAAGAKRFMRLQVAGPFHSPLMAGAADEFKPVLDKVVFKNPAALLFSNVTGKKVTSGEEAKKLALAQITSAVRWTDEEASIIAESGALGVEACLETGPGKVLQGLWRDSGSSLPCHPAGTAVDIDKLFQ